MNNLKNINYVYKKAYIIRKNYSWILDSNQINNFWVTHTFKIVISSKL